MKTKDAKITQYFKLQNSVQKPDAMNQFVNKLDSQKIYQEQEDQVWLKQIPGSGTPKISDIEEEINLNKNQLIYIMPNHIIYLWNDIKKILEGLVDSSKVVPFTVQQAIEDIFRLHYRNVFENSLLLKELIPNEESAIQESEEKKQQALNAIVGAARLALKIEQLFPDFLPILDKQDTLRLTYEQSACLVANMFFCTLHRQPDHTKFPQNFIMAKLFQLEQNVYFLYFAYQQNDRRSQKVEKIKCFIAYFMNMDSVLKGSITITRNVLNQNNTVFSTKQGDNETINKEAWINCELQLCEVVCKHSGKIEDEGNDAILVDFANQFIGGGVLASGCVQEEILFAIYPQLLVTILVAHKLERNEAILVEGLQRFSDYSGYSSSFKYLPLVFNPNKTSRITCIDAHNYQNKDCIFNEVQFTQAEVIHEMTKAFVGFNVPGNECISTGRWGCGVFQGDWQLKLLVQMVAASAAGCKKMVFYNTDEMVKNGLDEFLSSLRMIQINSVGMLCGKVLEFCSNKLSKKIDLDLLTYLRLL